MSTAQSTKAIYLAKHSIAKEYDFVCYDPEGVSDLSEKPASECLEMFDRLEFSHWFDDANTAIKYIQQASANKKIIIIGSSMGGWITLFMAQKYPELIQGVILIAPAINFTRKMYLNWYNVCTIDEKKRLDAGETIIVNSAYGDKPMSKRFIETSYVVEMDLTSPINVDCPVKILHGVQDDTVNFESSIGVMKLLTSQDVDLLYRKSGDHRLSEKRDLELLSETLDKMMKTI